MEERVHNAELLGSSARPSLHFVSSVGVLPMGVVPEISREFAGFMVNTALLTRTQKEQIAKMPMSHMRLMAAGTPKTRWTGRTLAAAIDAVPILARQALAKRLMHLSVFSPDVCELCDIAFLLNPGPVGALRAITALTAHALVEGVGGSAAVTCGLSDFTLHIEGKPHSDWTVTRVAPEGVTVPRHEFEGQLRRLSHVTGDPGIFDAAPVGRTGLSAACAFVISSINGNKN